MREEEPVIEDEPDDFSEALPSMTSAPGSKIRIPPELMPDEETILHYFDLYFANVHPYVPVLNKEQILQQWHTDRQSISPLVLEAIFAVAGRLADEPAQGQQWIALASSKLRQRVTLLWLLKLTNSRTCRFVHGHTATQYPPGSLDYPQST